MGAPPDSDRAAISGFQPVHRVAQSYLGSLWIALDQRQGEPGKPVLLRRLQLPAKTPPEARERIALAGREAIELRHPNVLAVLEVIEEGGELAVVHEHIEGEPLRSLQSWANLRGLTFPVGVTLKIMNDLLQGVTALHEGASSASVSPVGGLSPDSVLVSRAGETRICDPLIASCASLLEGIGFNTAKLAYVAPEQVHVVAPLTPPCDVFTCGALLWELLAARRLLSGSRPAIERKLLEHNLPDLALNLRGDHQLSSALIELVGKALAADPAKRPSSPEALREALQGCGHELASQEQVAQFVGKLSGQRFDRRSAAVRSKSLPELEAPLELPLEVASSSSSLQAPKPAPPPASDAQTERSSEPPALSSALAEPQKKKKEPSTPRKPMVMPKPHQRPAPAGLPTALPQPGSALAPSANVSVSAPRAEARPAAPQKAAPQQPAPRAPASVRGTPPSFVEPPPMPASVATEEEDSTVRVDQAPDDWFDAHVAPPALPPPVAAPPTPAAAPPVPLSAPAVGRRTVAGVGGPPHPALAATLPFGRATPEPFVAAAPAPQPEPLPSPSAALAAPPVPMWAPAPPSTERPPSSARPSSSTLTASHTLASNAAAPPPSGAPGQRSLPPGIPSLRGYEPTFALAPEELVPRVAPSGRVTRPRSGWARALGGRATRGKTLIAGAAACVALASAVAVVLLLRRPPPKPELPLEVTPAARQNAEPELPPTAPVEDRAAQTNSAGTQPDAGADAPPAGDSVAADAAELPGGGGLDSPQLDDAQLAQLFALEQHEDVPTCPERAPAGKARSKKSASKGAKEAVRLLKVARTELKRGKTEKAHGLLCRATTQDPSNHQAQRALAELSLQLGNPAQAQAAVEKALTRKPEDPTLLGILGDALALSNDLPGSRRAWLRTFRSQGSDDQRLQLLANNYRKMAERLQRSSSYAAACSLFRRAVVLSEGSYAPSIGLAEALRRLQQPRAALAWAERAAHAFPNDSRVQVLYGNALFDNGQKEQAFAAWRAARKTPSKLAKGKP